MARVFVATAGWSIPREHAPSVRCEGHGLQREPGGIAALRYIRWHGSPRTYWSEYGEERLKPLVDWVRQEPVDTEVWCVFDNTASGAALGDALRFSRMIAVK